MELPSTITLDQLHEVLQWVFDWSNFGPHSFVTIHGEFGGPVWPMSRASKRATERRDEAGIMLAQVAGEEGSGLAYLRGFGDEWRVDIQVEKILAAAPGVGYPRCTAGQGEEVPGDRYDGVLEFNADRDPFGADVDLDPEELADEIAHPATVIIPGQ